MEIGNASSRTVTPYAKLVKEEMFYTSGRKKRKYILSVLQCRDGQSIGPNTTEVHSELMCPIPENATLTIANCQIIDVQYYVMVSINTRAEHSVGSHQLYSCCRDVVSLI